MVYSTTEGIGQSDVRNEPSVGKFLVWIVKRPVPGVQLGMQVRQVRLLAGTHGQVNMEWGTPVAVDAVCSMPELGVLRD